MAYLGLVPSEHSSGGTRRQGGITKAGNGAARRMLIEAAWSYRFPARISREQLLRQERLAKPIRDTAGRRKSGYAGGIAFSRGRESRRQGSPSPSRESWRASSGRSPDKRSPPALDALNSILDRVKEVAVAKTHPMLGKAGGTVTARRTLAYTPSRISSNAGS